MVPLRRMTHVRPFLSSPFAFTPQQLLAFYVQFLILFLSNCSLLCRAPNFIPPSLTGCYHPWHSLTWFLIVPTILLLHLIPSAINFGSLSPTPYRCAWQEDSRTGISFTSRSSWLKLDLSRGSLMPVGQVL